MNGTRTISDSRAAPLPRAQVLSYITRADTPTRVRQITSGALLGFAFLYLLLTIWPVSVLYEQWDRIHFYFFSGGVWALSDYWEYALAVSAIVLTAFACITCAIVLVIFVGSVRGGRRTGCNIATLTIVPGFVLAFYKAASFAGWALLNGLGFLGGDAEPESLWYLLPAAMLTLLVLLIWDVLQFLRWIARNPLEEKPPVPFLPQKPVVGSHA